MKTLLYHFDDIFSGGWHALSVKTAETAEYLGLNGDVWANYLAYRLLTDENLFSLAAEKGAADGSVSELVRADVEAVVPLFTSKFSLSRERGWSVLRDYRVGKEKSLPCAVKVKRLADKLTAIANESFTDDFTCKESAVNGFIEALKEEYFADGAGVLSINDAFRLVSDGTEDGYRLIPVPNFSPKKFGEIIGYDAQKKALMENTRAFINGEACNNVLLYGDAGTGKSTSVKALSTEFADEKLKIVEIYKRHYSVIERLMSDLGNRGCKFILFLDDLSFEETESEYKYFKAVLEGGLGCRPDNVVVYATSNRVHLIKESFSDRADISHDDIHRSDTVEEKISLSARFGLSLFYPAPDTKEYLRIVSELVAAAGLDINPVRLETLAMRWATAQNKKSGRTAEQFVKSLLAGIEEI